MLKLTFVLIAFNLANGNITIEKFNTEGACAAIETAIKQRFKLRKELEGEGMTVDVGCYPSWDAPDAIQEPSVRIKPTSK